MFLSMLLSTPAWGQLFQGTSTFGVVVQHEHSVGLVWVQGTGDPCRYTEFWFLGPDYVYPNTPGTYAELNVRPDAGDAEFDTPRGFFEHAREVFPGGKLVVSDVVELEHCDAGGGGS